MRASRQEQVRTYFSGKAAQYQTRSHRGIFRNIRERERQAILSFLPQTLRGLQVLDACCGAGFYAREMLRRGADQVTAIDLSPAMLAQFDDPKICKKVGDVAAIELDQRFDWILCAGGLEFMDSPQPFLANAARWARASSRLVVLSPPQSWSARVYQVFHRLQGLKIRLTRPGEMDGLARAEGWELFQIAQPHPFATVRVYARN